MFVNRTSTYDNLRFLTVDQALADIAVLVATLREHLSSDYPKVFVWGTGYGGTLVILMFNCLEVSSEQNQSKFIGNVCTKEVSPSN